MHIKFSVSSTTFTAFIERQGPTSAKVGVLVTGDEENRLAYCTLLMGKNAPVRQFVKQVTHSNSPKVPEYAKVGLCVCAGISSPCLDSRYSHFVTGIGF